MAVFVAKAGLVLESYEEALTSPDVGSFLHPDYAGGIGTSTEDTCGLPSYEHLQIIERLKGVPASWRILDVGAGSGNLKHRARLVDITNEWIEYDTPAAVAGHSHLTDVWPSPPIDIVIFSCSLHIMPDPFAMLKQVAALHPRMVIISALPVWNNSQKVFLSVGYKFLPLWVFNRCALLLACQPLGTVTSMWDCQNPVLIEDLDWPREGWLIERDVR